MRRNELRNAWREGRPTLGLWITNPSPVAVEQLGSVGYDYLCLDLQHGLIDYADALSLLQALQRSESTPICRAPWNEPGIIGKLLDAGAMGIVVPMVNTPEEAVAAVRSCRYAPAGSRSFGPARAARALGPDYTPEANDQIACIPMIETAEALSNLDAILDVDGIDAVYIGPADLSLSLGLPPRSDHDDEAFATALADVIEGATRRGIAPGIHTIPEVAAKRLEQGFLMVTVTNDLAALDHGARGALSLARGDGMQQDGSLY